MVANTMNPDQAAPQGSSLIFVHSVCNKGYLRTLPNERTDDKSGDWLENGLLFIKISFKNTRVSKGLDPDQA